jgi:hypothetical protein
MLNRSNALYTFAAPKTPDIAARARERMRNHGLDQLTQAIALAQGMREPFFHRRLPHRSPVSEPAAAEQASVCFCALRSHRARMRRMSRALLRIEQRRRLKIV